MEFSPVSAGKTRQHKQTSRTNTKNPSWPENCLCCGEDHGITTPPPCFSTVGQSAAVLPKQSKKQYNNSRSGPLEKNNLLEQKKCGLPTERTCVTQRRKARKIKTEARIAAQKQESTNIHHKITVRAIKIMSYY